MAVSKMADTSNSFLRGNFPSAHCDRWVARMLWSPSEKNKNKTRKTTAVLDIGGGSTSDSKFEPVEEYDGETCSETTRTDSVSSLLAIDQQVIENENNLPPWRCGAGGGGVGLGSESKAAPSKDSDGQMIHHQAENILSSNGWNLSYVGEGCVDSNETGEGEERILDAAEEEIVRFDGSRGGSRSPGGIDWTGDAQDFHKIQAAVAQAASKVPQIKLSMGYSFHQSTEQNYCAEGMQFYGAFDHVRATLDYSFHSNYTRERQQLQDAIISKKLGAPVASDDGGDGFSAVSTEQWIVFTAGPMGAGKGFTLHYLEKRNFFPLKTFVSVDPDEIRRLLPEYMCYVANDPTSAGKHTRNEAGYIAEILTGAALKRGNNVIVDGSLSNSSWYKQYFQKLRRDYPKLRIAIFHVTAPREVVLRRAAERALETLRFIPLETLEKALDRVPKSVNELAPLTDYFCEFYNAPGIDEIEIRTEGQTWETFQRRWQHLDVGSETAKR